MGFCTVESRESGWSFWVGIGSNRGLVHSDWYQVDAVEARFTLRWVLDN